MRARNNLSYMYRCFLLILFFSSSVIFSQSHDRIELGAGFAHFDDTDGAEFSISYSGIHLNRYLSLSMNVNYAKTSDFPSLYSYPEISLTEDYYWFTKSTILNIIPLAHLHFIRDEKHDFSFFAGIGYMFIDAADNTMQKVTHDTHYYLSTMESYARFSRTIGVRYAYTFNQFGVGINIKLVDTLLNDDKYFGQDNYRSIGLFLSKKI